MKKINLFFVVFFLAFSYSVFASWDENNHDLLNSRNSDFIYNFEELEYDSFNALKIRGFDEFVQSGNNLYGLSGGFLNKFNYSSGLVLDVQVLSDSISTPYIYDDSYIFTYSTSNFYVYDLNLNIISSTSLGLTAIDYNETWAQAILHPQMACIKYYDDVCYFQANNETLVKINVTNVNSPSITLIPNIFAQNISFKPVPYSCNGLTEDCIAVFCSDATKKGIRVFNISGNGVNFENCSMTSDYVFGSPRYINRGGGFPEIFFVSASTPSPAQAVRMHSLSRAGIEDSGFPYFLGVGYIGGISVVNGNIPAIISYYSSGGNNYITYWKILTNGSSIYKQVNGNVNLVNHQKDSGVFSENGVFSYGAYFTNSGVNYDIDTRTSSSYTTLASQGYEMTSAYTLNGNKYFFLYDVSGNVKVYSVGSVLLNYPNGTFNFRNNKTNTSIGSLEFSIIQSGFTLYNGYTDDTSRTFVLNSLNAGKYNLSFNQTGYIPYYAEFTLYNGTRDYYFYAEPNSSMTGLVTITLYDAETGLNIDSYSEIDYLFKKEDGFTSPAGETTSLNGIHSINLSVGNYSAVIGADFYKLRAVNFFHDSVTNLEYALEPILVTPSALPYVTDVKTYSVERTITGDKIDYKRTNSPFNLCLNETLFFNVSSYKRDNETYWVVLNCGDGSDIKPISSGLIGLNRDLWQFCEYNIAGTYDWYVIAVSDTFPFNSDWDSYISNNYGKKGSINVTSSCIGNRIENKTLIEISQDDPIASYFEGLGVNSYKYKRTFALIVILILVVGTIISISKYSLSASMGLGAGGIVGALAVLLFFAIGFISPSILLFVLLICAFGIAVAVKGTAQG